ncbi:putative DNA/RNA non-specific endonuclease [Salmonella enterica subsp. enterica serovar Urbana str. R8-2977]|uniref:Putative DNA/RNA non-specific endonuclease n=1 Tax=Salmonella enterica subsp. enterica serovar Urbana str. R8-2977 TaxID=913084 RepID=G5RW32_SALET|nr:putative DNA/RNA non-specific endonuclease [Salmonella enterica subsp. enterica serovar Urbana str. R8-2977]
MNKTINLLKLLPVVLLSACTTSYPPQDTTSAPELPHRNVLVQQPDNCSVGCPQGGSQQTIYRHVYTLNNNSARHVYTLNNIIIAPRNLPTGLPIA